MRIAFVVQRYFPAHLTGSEFFVARVIPYLKKRGLDIAVITSDSRYDWAWYLPGFRQMIKPPREEKNEVDVYRLPVQWYRSSWHRVGDQMARWLNKDRAKHQLSYFGPYLSGLPETIGLAKPDLVHAVTFPCSYLWQLSQMKSAPPLVVTPFYHASLYGQRNPELTMALRQARQVIAMTNFEKHVIVANTDSRAPVSVIPLGIDLKEMKQADGRRFRQQHGLSNKFIVLFAGTKCYDKGTLTTLTAIRDLHQKDPKNRIAFVVIGGASAEWLANIRPDDRSFLLDFPYVPLEEKKDAFAAADLLCMPSRADSFGLTYLEAWLLRKPVIGAKTGATPDVIDDGVNGRLISFGRAGELATVINSLAKNPKLTKQYGEAGYAKVVKQYNWETVADRLVALYQDVLKN